MTLVRIKDCQPKGLPTRAHINTLTHETWDIILNIPIPHTHTYTHITVHSFQSVCLCVRQANRRVRHI